MSHARRAHIVIKVLAHNLTAAVRGSQKKAFTLSPLGQLAAIGRRNLSKLPRVEKKVRVALDWTLDLIFAKDLVQFLTVRAPTMAQREASQPPSVPVTGRAAPAALRARL
jgi:NADH dehydrogenase